MQIWAHLEGHQPTRNLARDNIRIDLGLYIKAKVTGSVNKACSLPEFCPVRINTPVAAYTINLERQRNIIVPGPTVKRSLSDFLFLRYFKRPSLHHCLLFSSIWSSSTYWKMLPSSLQSQNSSILQDTSSPADFVEPWGSTNDAFLVARIRFVSPFNSELFSLALILLERQMTLLAKWKTWEGRQYNTIHEPSVAMRLYRMKMSLKSA